MSREPFHPTSAAPARTSQKWGRDYLSGPPPRRQLLTFSPPSSTFLHGHGTRSHANNYFITSILVFYHYRWLFLSTKAFQKYYFLVEPLKVLPLVIVSYLISSNFATHQDMCCALCRIIRESWTGSAVSEWRSGCLYNLAASDANPELFPFNPPPIITILHV